MRRETLKSSQKKKKKNKELSLTIYQKQKKQDSISKVLKEKKESVFRFNLESVYGANFSFKGKIRTFSNKSQENVSQQTYAM